MFAKCQLDLIVQDNQQLKQLIDYVEPSKFKNVYVLFLLLVTNCPDEMEESVIDWTCGQQGGQSMMQEAMESITIRRLWTEVMVDARIPGGLRHECRSFYNPTMMRIVSNLTEAQLRLQGIKKDMLVNRLIRARDYNMLRYVVSCMAPEDLCILNGDGLTPLQDALKRIFGRDITHSVDRCVYILCENACRNSNSSQLETQSENKHQYPLPRPDSIAAMFPFEEIGYMTAFNLYNHAMVEHLLRTATYVVHSMLQCRVPHEHCRLWCVCKQWRNVSWAIAAGPTIEESEERAKKRVKLNKEGADKICEGNLFSRLPDAVVHFLLSHYVPCEPRKAINIHEITNEKNASLYDVVDATTKHVRGTIMTGRAENRAMYAVVLEAMDDLLKVLGCIKDEYERSLRSESETDQANPLRLQLLLERIFKRLK